MIERSEIVRVDCEIGSYLALPPAEGARRIMQAFELSGNKSLYVAAIVGRLVIAASMGDVEEGGDCKRAFSHAIEGQP